MKKIEWDIINKGDNRLKEYLQYIGYSTWTNFSPPNNHYIIPRRNEIIANRLRLEQCRLPAYTHKLGLVDNPLCSLCNEPYTITHMLSQCPKHRELHNKLKDINKNKETSITKILFDQPCINEVIHYITKNKIQI